MWIQGSIAITLIMLSKRVFAREDVDSRTYRNNF
jgi:hypothetical protein